MILTFSKNEFVEAIKNGTKIHTIREDPKRRWKPGMKIHFWRGNPRNVHQNPYQFAEGVCTAVQEIEFVRPCKMCIAVKIEGAEPITDYKFFKQLAANDGLTEAEFIEWFDPLDKPPFKGVIIHWTDFKYSQP